MLGIQRYGLGLKGLGCRVYGLGFTLKNGAGSEGNLRAIDGVRFGDCGPWHLQDSQA